MKLIGAILCKLTGHKRGRRITKSSVAGTDMANDVYIAECGGHIIMRCPRCHATWTRKVKQKEQS